MTEIEGVVSGTFNKDFQGTMLYSFKIEGNQKFFRLGQKKPDFKEGQCIKFVERNNNVDWNSIEILTDAPQSTTTDASASAPTGAPSVDVGARIRHQAARADATRLVVAALHTDHLPHSANTAKGKRLDLLIGYVEQVTKQLLEQEENA